MGVRLFAWLGGLALFLAVAYFVKYSFERNLIPPAVRVLMGLAMGVGLLVGGVRLKRREYAVTSQTLCATGVVVLYAALFAGHGLYHLAWLGTGSTFFLMTVVTAVAFVLAVRMPALVVAVLGMLGGFLTPLLLSSGEDQPVALFGYLALLDAGLLAVALRRRWHFLAVLGAFCTVLMQVGWVARFFGPDRVGLAFLIFGGFTALFLVALAVARWREEASEWLAAGVGVVVFAMLGFAGYLMSFGELALRPGLIFGFVLAADVALLAVAWWRDRVAGLHAVAGGVAFLYVMIWMGTSLTSGLLGWGLGLSLVFAVLHTGFPILWQRCHPGVRQAPLAQYFPPLALATLLVPLLKLETPSFAIWPVVMLINLLAFALAAVSSGMIGVVVALLLSGIATAVWIGRLPSEVGEVGGALLIVIAMAVLFVGAGVTLLRRGSRTVPGSTGGLGVEDEAWQQQMPVMAVLLPFLLLAQMVAQVRLPDPSLVFAGAGVILAMLFGLTLWLRVGVLPLAGLVGVALVEGVWAMKELGTTSRPGTVVFWAVLFQAAFAVFPMVLLSGRLPRWTGRAEAAGEANDGSRVGNLPWVAAALGGVPQFLLAHRVFEIHWPNPVMGLVPLAFAVMPGLLFLGVLKRVDAGHPERLSRLAWLAGATLFFVTVALPIQFERHWLTVGLALEGAALLALYGRVPHPGLKAVGVGLLAVVFVRLTMNPWLLEDAIRGGVPLLNRWLYTYGVGAAALFAGAQLLRPGTEAVLGVNARKPLVAGGTVLLFALVNLEVAEFFTPVGEIVRFEFSGNFGRDMTYTIAWSLFALALVAAGLGRRWVASRRAGLILLAVALAKLFLHDLARLDQLYRIGALAGVAVVAIAASVLYQRFVAREANPTQM